MKFEGIKITNGSITENIPYSTIKEYEEETLNSRYGYEVIEKVELYNCEVLSITDLSVLYNWRSRISKEGRHYWGNNFLTKNEIEEELKENKKVFVHGKGEIENIKELN